MQPKQAEGYKRSTQHAHVFVLEVVRTCWENGYRQERWLSFFRGKVGCAHAPLVQCLRPKVPQLPHLADKAGSAQKAMPRQVA